MSEMVQENIDYGWKSAQPSHVHAYLFPSIDTILAEVRPARVFDLGCGNGSTAHHLSQRYEVVGVDPSPSAVKIANASYPNIRIELGSGYDDLAAKFGTFPAVISLEVVEHLYDPRRFARNLFELLEPGGTAIVSTPYHGYLKNLALAVTGKFDRHFTALWDGGHIKFWSIKTLGALLKEAGFEDIRFHRVGRVPAIAFGMIAVAHKP
jgi:2-polyprenyl-6-hydroxyphenyl methylase/3-demethylubiquinone-9 3-methyltransferase